VLGSTALTQVAAADGTLNVLTWCDHETRRCCSPSSRQQRQDQLQGHRQHRRGYWRCSVQSKPGDWDVLVVDQTDTGRLVDKKLLAPLDAKDLPLRGHPGEIADPKLSSVNGTLYTVPEKFGYNPLPTTRPQSTRRR